MEHFRTASDLFKALSQVPIPLDGGYLLLLLANTNVDTTMVQPCIIVKDIMG